VGVILINKEGVSAPLNSRPVTRVHFMMMGCFIVLKENDATVE
jgi:hypothetical protein